MLQEVIDHVNALGKADGIPSQLTFFDSEGRPVKLVELEAQADTPVDDHDKITGVPQGPN